MLDIRTITLTYVLTDLLCTTVLFLYWRIGRERHPGAGWWVADFLAQTVGMILIALRPAMPLWLSIMGGNALAFGGAACGTLAIGRFGGVRVRPAAVFGLAGVFLLIHAWFTFVAPDLAVRDLNIALYLSAVFIWGLALIRFRFEPEARRQARALVIAYGVFLTINLVRVAAFFSVQPDTEDFFHSGTFNAFMMLGYQLSFILLTFALVLTYHRRLLAEVSASEAKYAAAFRSSPSALVLTRESDGLVIEANPRTSDMFGFSPAEITGRSTPDLGIWGDPTEREAMLAALGAEGRVRQRETVFHRKDGSQMLALYSAERLRVGGVGCLLSMVDDVTEFRRSAREVESLLHEKEILLREVHHRIKNNMAAVAGLLELQALEVSDPGIDAPSVLKAAAGRVRSLMFLYERLFESNLIGQVDAGAHLAALAREIVRLAPHQEPVTLELDVEPLSLDARVVSNLGVLLNELVSNSVKHAFPGRPGTIRVGLSSLGGGLIRFEVADDGVGMAVGQPPPERGGFGLRLVDLLAAQLGGTARVESLPGAGVRTRLEFAASRAV